jgi:hypothetical protein
MCLGTAARHMFCQEAGIHQLGNDYAGVAHRHEDLAYVHDSLVVRIRIAAPLPLHPATTFCPLSVFPLHFKNSGTKRELRERHAKVVHRQKGGQTTRLRTAMLRPFHRVA